ncbi:MAG TPA: hypothetical protein VL978_11625 [Puia sp.]|nr:hypothetical protein [Puia sp.]
MKYRYSFKNVSIWSDLKNPDNPIRLDLDISDYGRLHFFCSNFSPSIFKVTRPPRKTRIVP